MFKWNDSFFELEQIGMKYNRFLNAYQKSLPLVNYELMYNSLIPATIKMYQPPLLSQVPSSVLTPSYLPAIRASLPVTKTYLPFAEKYFPVAKVPYQFINTFNRPEINRMVQASETIANLIPKSIPPSVFQSPVFIEMQSIYHRLKPIVETYHQITSAETFLNQEFTIDIGNDRTNEISDLIASSVPDTIEEKPDILQSLSNRMTPAAILALVGLLLETTNLVLTVSGINCRQITGFREVVDWLIKALEFYCICNNKSSDVKKIEDGTGRFNQERKS